MAENRRDGLFSASFLVAFFGTRRTASEYAKACQLPSGLLTGASLTDFRWKNPMSQLDLASIVQRDQGLISADMDGETVMLNIDNGKYYGLGGIALDLWEWIEQPIPIGILVQRVVERFDVDEETCRADVLALLSELREHKLIQVQST